MTEAEEAVALVLKLVRGAVDLNREHGYTIFDVDDPRAFIAGLEAQDPPFTVVRKDSLDAAWAEAEAAMPKGWSFGLSPYWQDGGWYGWEIEAHAAEYEFDGERALSTGTLGAYETPIAALHALTTKLRENQ